MDKGEIHMNASERIKRIAFSKAYDFLDRDPEQNFLKLVEWLEKLDKNGYIARQLPTIQKYANDPNSNWYRLARSLWDDVDDEVRKTLFTNFMINGNLLENQRLTESRKRYQCNIPWMILLCPAGEASENGDGGETGGLSFDDMDNIVEQGKELGVYFYLFFGREPVGHCDDIIALCNKNSDCVFLCQTNGTIVDSDFAQELLRVRNLIPAITVREPLETSARQREAMEILREHRLAFGALCQYSAANWDSVSSEAFFDDLILRGAKFAWFTTYLPVGTGGRPEKIVTAEQRETVYRRIHQFRKSKAIFTLDFFNDGTMTGGCLGGGRGYFFINAAGEAEPCAFLHYTDSNIHEKSLLEILQSPLFQSIREHQPLDANLLRSCPIADHPECLEALICESGAVSSSRRDREEPQALAQKCTACAQNWAETADRLWQESRGDKV